MVAFLWNLLHNRLLTSQNLLKRQIVSSGGDVQATMYGVGRVGKAYFCVV